MHFLNILIVHFFFYKNELLRFISGFWICFKILIIYAECMILVLLSCICYSQHQFCKDVITVDFIFLKLLQIINKIYFRISSIYIIFASFFLHLYTKKVDKCFWIHFIWLAIDFQTVQILLIINTLGLPCTLCMLIMFVATC